MNQNLPTEWNSICNRTHIYFYFFEEVNLIVFLQYKTTREIEFEEYLGFPAQHLEEGTKSLNRSHCYKETCIENMLKNLAMY